jgi:hypothetical protein
MSDDEGAFIQMAGDDMEDDFSDDMAGDDVDDDFSDDELPDSSIERSKSDPSVDTNQAIRPASNTDVSEITATLVAEESSLTAAIMLDSVPAPVDERAIDTCKDELKDSLPVSPSSAAVPALQNVHEYDAAQTETETKNTDLYNEVKSGSSR